MSEDIKGLEEEYPVIVVGDFNFSPSGASKEIYNLLLAKAKLIDVPTAITGKIKKWGVDRIFYRSGKKVWLEPVLYKEEKRVFVDENGEELSDHKPNVAYFNWALIVEDDSAL